MTTSVLGCLLIRCTAASPGLFPSRGLSGALLLYRMNSDERHPAAVDLGDHRADLRALAGLRFPRVGGSECDVMFHLVPEVATADSPRCSGRTDASATCSTTAPSISRCAASTCPESSSRGNNCVAEHGDLPSNFLLGSSTPAGDIRFRRQMRSRLGEPITVAGNPPCGLCERVVRSAERGSQAAGLLPVPDQGFLHDLFSIGIPAYHRGAHLHDSVCLPVATWTYTRSPVLVIARILTEAGLLLLCVAIKKCLVGSEWGVDHSTPFWSWRHFAYFFAQDCFFVWLRRPLGFCAGTILANPILRWMGCRLGRRSIIGRPLQCSDWNAASFGDDRVIDRFLQFTPSGPDAEGERPASRMAAPSPSAPR